MGTFTSNWKKEVIIFSIFKVFDFTWKKCVI